MKIRSTLFLSFWALTTMTALAHATGGETGTHGGDIQCDARVKAIATDIAKWIKSGGPEVGQLDLPSSLNGQTGRPYSLAEYDSRMLDLLDRPLDVSCVSQGEPGYPVAVQGSVKICENTLDDSGIHMICDRATFMGLSDELQYQQIHHEFATNVRGLEPDNGPLSSYLISLQISGHLQEKVIKTLAVSPPPAAGARYTFLKNKYLHETSDSITYEKLQGAYLGRCYLSVSDVPRGMILTTRQFTTEGGTNTDNGPYFPAFGTSLWMMGLFYTGKVDDSRVPTPEKDKEAISMINDLWAINGWHSSDQPDPAAESQLKIIGGTARQGFGDYVDSEARLGNDGLIYVRTTSGAMPNIHTTEAEYCYFFKKVLWK